jgi:two-component system chemotaxis response regulator CheB
MVAMPVHDIVVIGASAGGLEALKAIVAELGSDYPGSIFVTLHLASGQASVLPRILTKNGPLEAVAAEDEAPIDPGRIYVAPPDFHLVTEPDVMRCVGGPKENYHRPAIDPMFRSAARAYGARVVGVLLSGANDDGAAGLLAVKLRNGIAIVQDPDEAAFPVMPQSALDQVAVDHRVPAREIGSLLDRLARQSVEVQPAPLPRSGDDPESVLDEETEDALLEGDPASSERHGTPSVFSCPDCGGVLWELDDGRLPRYRCRVGHAYSVDSLLAGQAEEVEETLWMALRALHEQSETARSAARRARGRPLLVARFEERAINAERRAEQIRATLRRFLTLSEQKEAPAEPQE